MLSNDDHSGLSAFMVGIVILVMAAVGLSLMVNRGFNFSNRASDLRKEVVTDETELEQLKARRDEIRLQLAEAEPAQQMIAAQENIFRQLKTLNQRRAVLLASQVKLQSTILALEQEFTSYRTAFRKQIWAAAKGESLGDLTIRGGREFRQAVIDQVTEVGLEIHHESGTARLQAPDLDPAMQDRFQWNDEERRARLGEEQAQQKAVTQVPDPNPPIVSQMEKPTRTSQQDTQPDAGKLEPLRNKVRAWKTKVAQLTAERNEALSAASYRSQSSVPGSLETWRAKAERLGAELAKAKSQLAAATADLRTVAPRSQLLRVSAEGR